MQSCLPWYAEHLYWAEWLWSWIVSLFIGCRVDYHVTLHHVTHACDLYNYTMYILLLLVLPLKSRVKSIMYECQICEQYARHTLAEIMWHVRDTHRHFDGPVRCGIDGCPATPRSYDGLRQHVYKKHRDVLIPPFQNEPGSHDSIVYMILEVIQMTLRLRCHLSLPPTRRLALNLLQHERQTLEAAHFILKIRDGKRLTQTTTDGIVKDVQYMLDYSFMNHLCQT